MAGLGGLGGWSQVFPHVKKPDVEVLGVRVWLHMVCGCEGRLEVQPNSLKLHLRWLMVEKLIFKSLATTLVDIPAVSMFP